MEIGYGRVQTLRRLWKKRSINFILKGGNDEVKSYGDFSTQLTWCILRSRKQQVGWYNIIWFKCHIPKHVFILWLMVKGRKYTKDKLV